MTTTTVRKETHKSRGHIPASCKQTQVLPLADLSSRYQKKKTTNQPHHQRDFWKVEKKKRKILPPQLKTIWARHSCDLQSKVEQNSRVRSTTINTRQRRQPAPPPPPRKPGVKFCEITSAPPQLAAALQECAFSKENLANPPARHTTPVRKNKQN